jgi:hypothetical protein
MIKVGMLLIYKNQVDQEGVLIDISTWQIEAQARANAVDGPLLGNYTVIHDGLGKYTLRLETDTFEPCNVYTDVRLTVPGSGVIYTDTDIQPLLPAVTHD